MAKKDAERGSNATITTFGGGRFNAGDPVNFDGRGGHVVEVSPEFAQQRECGTDSNRVPIVLGSRPTNLFEVNQAAIICPVIVLVKKIGNSIADTKPQLVAVTA